ncbi:hypothetical protein RC083_05055 [Pseudoalteromonas haloplanktis]|uniref:DUF4064 domain-containing protein n=1 Tax=Pseudoalteromonas haloplanktis TaxID=228 RepID=A0ABU1BB08_PSEHA|nr:hypothetical protein [Pseudoalteromonas haloplanktis]MDQ9090961.1 hypothetical protein [Pseudoalteromonas haloplanktis]
MFRVLLPSIILIVVAGFIGMAIGESVGKSRASATALYSKPNLTSYRGIGFLIGLIVFVVLCIKISEGEGVISFFTLAIPISIVVFIELLISESTKAFNIVMSGRIKIHEQGLKKKQSKDNKKKLLKKLQFWK